MKRPLAFAPLEHLLAIPLEIFDRIRRADHELDRQEAARGWQRRQVESADVDAGDLRDFGLDVLLQHLGGRPLALLHGSSTKNANAVFAPSPAAPADAVQQEHVLDLRDCETRPFPSAAVYRSK